MSADPSPRGRKRKDLSVGYGRPPQQHRFKPGQSGNPKGRPRGSKNESTLVREILERKIESRSNGRTRKISVLEGIILKMVEEALKGNTKTAAFVLNRYAAMVSGDLPPQDLGDDDRAVLEAFAARLNTADKQNGEPE
ncbi:DUF5681 domain-containing protein [Bradyrhizobium sp. JYMT SZCCT0180]|uniref:DUF5681 domain-containing protein n=1 Tax=Bradyrhizobium sp. JYMT SZCCT0180 TaxID=2807666 RepID=UPI001BA97E9D|nr:hypothetical protein [Bradyrhizobium sp. JYMT SZCCT0180]